MISGSITKIIMIIIPMGHTVKKCTKKAENIKKRNFQSKLLFSKFTPLGLPKKSDSISEKLL